MKNEIASIIGTVIGIIAVYFLKVGLDNWIGTPSWLNWFLSVVLLFVVIMAVLYIWGIITKHKNK